MPSRSPRHLHIGFDLASRPPLNLADLAQHCHATAPWRHAPQSTPYHRSEHSFTLRHAIPMQPLSLYAHVYKLAHKLIHVHRKNRASACSHNPCQNFQTNPSTSAMKRRNPPTVPQTARFINIIVETHFILPSSSSILIPLFHSENMLEPVIIFTRLTETIHHRRSHSVHFKVEEAKQRGIDGLRKHATFQPVSSNIPRQHANDLGRRFVLARHRDKFITAQFSLVQLKCTEDFANVFSRGVQ